MPAPIMAPVRGMQIDLHALVDAVAVQHGSGLLHLVLDSLHRARAVRVEGAVHGCFVKAFFPKNENSTPPATATCSGTASRTVKSSLSPSPISRADMLRMRARLQQDGKESSAAKAVSVPILCASLPAVGAEGAISPRASTPASASAATAPWRHAGSSDEAVLSTTASPSSASTGRPAKTAGSAAFAPIPSKTFLRSRKTVRFISGVEGIVHVRFRPDQKHNKRREELLAAKTFANKKVRVVDIDDS